MTAGFGAFGWFAQHHYAVTAALLPTFYSGLLAWHDVGDDNTYVTYTTSSTRDVAAWTQNGTTLTASRPDPFGGNNAWEITETGGASATHNLNVLYTAIPAGQGGDREIDFYIKRGTGSRHASVGISTSHFTVIDLDSGTLNGAGSQYGTTVPLQMFTSSFIGNGWWRLQGIISNTSSPTTLLYMCSTATSNANYAGDGASSLLFYHPQTTASFSRQRQITSLAARAGSIKRPMVQPQAAFSPFLIDNQSLGGKQTVGCFNSLNTKLLIDDPLIAGALSGSQVPFTVGWFGRNVTNGGIATADWFALSGSTAKYRALGVSSSYAYTMTRTDDSNVTTTPVSSSPVDYTPDCEWRSVFVVNTGTTASIYVDGNLSTSTYGLGTGATSYTGSLELFNQRYWRERVIYNRALSQTDIMNISMGMRSRAGLVMMPDPESPLSIPGVQGWWPVTASTMTITTASINSDLSAWTNAGSATLTISGSISGSTTAYLLTDSVDGSNQTHYRSSVIANPGTTSILFSLEVSGASGNGANDWIALAPNNSAFAGYFNPTTGVVQSTTGGNWFVTNLGGGWYRLEVEYTHSNTTMRLYSANVIGTSVTYTGTGRSVAWVRNITINQQRVSQINDQTFGRYHATQATANSQWLYIPGTSGSWFASASINNKETVGDSTSVAVKSVANTSIQSIWNGADRPMTVVSLMRREGVPTGNVDNVRLVGTTANHASIRTNTTGGTLDYSRTDNASTTVAGSVGILTTTSHTVTEVFTGTSSSYYVDGVITGSQFNLDVGQSTYGTNLVMENRRTWRRGTAVFNRALTDAERINVENGMKRRAGLI